MNLVVAVDEKWGIGYKGDLLVRLREDLKNFAALTRGKTVVLGSNTLATFPGGRVLKGRRNIVLNPDPDYAPEGATVAHSIPEALELIDAAGSDNVWVIGGMSIYRQLLPYCRRAYVTRIKADFKKDAFRSLKSSKVTFVVAWVCQSAFVCVVTKVILPSKVSVAQTVFRVLSGRRKSLWKRQMRYLGWLKAALSKRRAIL